MAKLANDSAPLSFSAWRVACGDFTWPTGRS
jgi:hypothetical protein